MANPTHPPAGSRKDIGKVVFPIETLIEARQSRHTCLHVEAVLQKKPARVDVIQSPSHIDVMGKEPT